MGFILSTYSHQISQTQLCIPIFCGVRYRPLNFHKQELLENPQSLRWAVPVQLGEWGKPFIRLTVDSILEQVECMKHVQGVATCGPLKLDLCYHHMYMFVEATACIVGVE